MFSGDDRINTDEAGAYSQQTGESNENDQFGKKIVVSIWVLAFYQANE